MKFQDKFIAFVDILGFEDLVERAENGGEGAPTVEHILELLAGFGSADEEDFAKYGPTTCPCAPHNAKDLDFRLTQISDCAVISAEPSPAGLINLVHHCYKIAVRLLKLGHLCRGYVTRGKIIHTVTQFMGTGYMRAYKSERGVSIFRTDAAAIRTPFIEIDPEVYRYVAEQPDACVKTVFGRLTESDGGSTAITPFYGLRMIPDMTIDDPVAYRAQIQVARDGILRLLSQLERAEATASANGRGKIEHYKRKLREVLASKDEQVEMLDSLLQPFPRKP